jgi:mRNA interferase HigB
LRIISKKKIRIYTSKNAQAELPLLEWYSKMLLATPKSYIELKKIFNSVDYARSYTIFNIGGNNYRLISAIHYNTQRCFIRTIMTHAEYSKSQNQLKLNRGEL